MRLRVARAAMSIRRRVLPRQIGRSGPVPGPDQVGKQLDAGPPGRSLGSSTGGVVIGMPISEPWRQNHVTFVEKVRQLLCQPRFVDLAIRVLQMVDPMELDSELCGSRQGFLGTKGPEVLFHPGVTVLAVGDREQLRVCSRAAQTGDRAPAPRISSSGWGATTSTLPLTGGSGCQVGRSANCSHFDQMASGVPRPRSDGVTASLVLSRCILRHATADFGTIEVGVTLADIHGQIHDGTGMTSVLCQGRRTERATHTVHDFDGVALDGVTNGQGQHRMVTKREAVHLLGGRPKDGNVLRNCGVDGAEVRHCDRIAVGASSPSVERLRHSPRTAVPTCGDPDRAHPESRSGEVLVGLSDRVGAGPGESDRAGIRALHAGAAPRGWLYPDSRSANGDGEQALSVRCRGIHQGMGHQGSTRAPRLDAFEDPPTPDPRGHHAIGRSGCPDPPPLTVFTTAITQLGGDRHCVGMSLHQSPEHQVAPRNTDQKSETSGRPAVRGKRPAICARAGIDEALVETTAVDRVRPSRRDGHLLGADSHWAGPKRSSFVPADPPSVVVAVKLVRRLGDRGRTANHHPGGDVELAPVPRAPDARTVDRALDERTASVVAAVGEDRPPVLPFIGGMTAREMPSACAAHISDESPPTGPLPSRSIP